MKKIIFLIILSISTTLLGACSALDQAPESSNGSTSASADSSHHAKKKNPFKKHRRYQRRAAHRLNRF